MKITHQFNIIYGIDFIIPEKKTERSPHVCNRWDLEPVFKIEVFNALQNTPFSKQPSKTQPHIEMETSLEVLDIIHPSQEPTSVLGHCHYKKWSWTIDS
jgi:hypothetical protein